MVIDLGSEYHFPKDSSAAIVSAGLPGNLGEQYIALTPGGGDQMLQAGDTIERTQSAIVPEDIIGKLMYSKMADADKVVDAGVVANQAATGKAADQGK